MSVQFAPQAGSVDESVLQNLITALQGLKFGSVEVTVHEGRIVQIERREKLRVNLPCPVEDRNQKESGLA